MLEKLLGRIFGRLATSPKFSNTRLSRWYDTNPYFKFEKGDILILKSMTFKYDLRPVISIREGDFYNDRYGKSAQYHLFLYRDNEGDYYSWSIKNSVPSYVSRSKHFQEIFSKLDIERDFKKVKVHSIDDALELYGAKEV